MRVSIAMATYNGAKYIREQLQSFIDQTRQPDELVITDDCSTDDTEIIVREFARKAPFKVEFHRNEENLGYCGNFNAALVKTSGDLVFLSDQDDVWFPEKIEYMAKIAEENPNALAFMNDAELTDGELNSVSLTKLGQMKSAGIGVDKFVMGCCAAVRHELLDLCLPIPKEIKGHDNWLIAFADGLNAKVVDFKVLQFYRRHDSNESQFIANRTSRINRLDRAIDTFKTVLKSSRNRDADNLCQLFLFKDRVSRVMHESPEKIRADLISLLDNLEKKIQVQKRRIAIRESKGAKKIKKSLTYVKDGGYSYKGGVKSFLRDLLSF